jgi:hypothetical protein
VLYVWRVFPVLRNSLARSSTTATPLSHRTASNQHKNNLSKLPGFDVEPRLRPVDVAPEIRLLPPPPPPPSIPYVPTSGDEQHNLHQAFPRESTRKLEEMETRFEKLQDEKEDLTGTRFRLQRDRRKASHLIREKTDETMGSALSQLQRFLEEEGITLPRTIQKEFEQIDSLRDQLGLREAEYDDAEQQYNDQEVKFIQRLSMFVDDLLDDLPHPLPTTSPDILESQASGVAEFTSENLDDWTVLGRRIEDDYIDPVTQTPTTTYTSVAASNGSTLLAESAASATSTQRQSAPAQDKVKLQNASGFGKQSRLSADPRIHIWQLGMISVSPLQKAHLLYQPPSAELYEASRWEGTGTNCDLISFAGAQFYMDHSTALENNTSGCSMMSELEDIYYSLVNKQRIPLRTSSLASSVSEGEWASDNATYHQAVPRRASKPTGDVTPKPRRSQTGSTDFETTRSLSLHRKPLYRHTSGNSVKSYNVVNQSPQIELYGKQRQRRHTTGAGARAVPGKEPKGLGTLNSTAHSRHYSDSLLVPNGESITSKKDASISVLTDPYTHIP